MDKAAKAQLEQGRKILGLPQAGPVDDALLQFADELLRWNQKVNLTAVTEPAEVVEKHLLDCLAVVPEVERSASLLDIGTGAGLPGVVLALACPALRVTLVDTVARKVGFLKHAVAVLGLAGRVRALQVRAEGRPEAEGVFPAEVVISRAFTDLGRWVPLAARYVAPGGAVVAMLGRPPEQAVLDAVAADTSLRLEAVRTFALPFSKASRAVVTFRHPAPRA